MVVNLQVSVETLAKMLSLLDRDVLEELFDKLMVEYDTSPLTEEEKKIVAEAEEAYKKRDLIVKSFEEI